MIVRILAEGQWRLDDGAVSELNRLDEAVEQAVAAGDQAKLSEVLGALLAEVRSSGDPLADDEMVDSDLILPDADATVADVKALLNDSSEGLIPG